jgi:hypothetical protein
METTNVQNQIQIKYRSNTKTEWKLVVFIKLTLKEPKIAFVIKSTGISTNPESKSKPA